MADGNHVVIDDIVTPTPAPVVPPAPAPAPVPVVTDTAKLAKTLLLVAHLLQGASKLTKDFDLDDRIADAFAEVAVEPWFVDLVNELLDRFKTEKATKAKLLDFVAASARK